LIEQPQKRGRVIAGGVKHSYFASKTLSPVTLTWGSDLVTLREERKVSGQATDGVAAGGKAHQKTKS